MKIFKGQKSLWFSLATGLFILAVVVALGAYYYDVSNYPPYIDYDSATLGVFVNNVSFQDRYDHFFKETRFSESQYRSWWAAEFLPVSIPLSYLQRLLGVAWWNVDQLLRIVGFVLGFLGSLCAALMLKRRDGWWDRIFFVSFLAVTPPFLLLLRTEVPHFMLTFFLFWLSLLLMRAFTRSNENKYLYLLSLPLAYFALAPYPPMVCLPFIFFLLLWREKQLVQVLKNRHAWGAFILLVILWFGAVLSISKAYGDSLSHDLAKAGKFLATRGGAIGFANFEIELLPHKLEKLLNQHLLFLRDNLGDVTRADDLWTLGSIHVLWLLAFPIGLFGLFMSLRRKEDVGRFFFSVLLVGYLFAFTVSFPEGRYLMIVLPCYVYFLLRGVKEIVGNQVVRRAALALLLLLTTGNTAYLVSGDYNRGMQKEYESLGGVREATRVFREELQKQDKVCLSLPRLTFDDLLYFYMLTNFKCHVLDRGTLLRLAGDRGDKAAARQLGQIIILRDAGQEQEIRLWSTFGFQVVRKFFDHVTGKPFVLLGKE